MATESGDKAVRQDQWIRVEDELPEQIEVADPPSFIVRTSKGHRFEATYQKALNGRWRWLDAYDAPHSTVTHWRGMPTFPDPVSAPAPEAPMRHYLEELLAIIHRDGGHYVADHGLDKAVEDACNLLSSIYLPAMDAQRSTERCPDDADECVCRHRRDEHDDGWLCCFHRTSASLMCNCMEFKLAFTAPYNVPKSDGVLRTIPAATPLHERSETALTLLREFASIQPPYDHDDECSFCGTKAGDVHPPTCTWVMAKKLTGISNSDYEAQAELRKEEVMPPVSTSSRECNTTSDKRSTSDTQQSKEVMPTEKPVSTGSNIGPDTRPSGEDKVAVAECANTGGPNLKRGDDIVFLRDWRMYKKGTTQTILGVGATCVELVTGETVPLEFVAPVNMTTSPSEKLGNAARPSQGGQAEVVGAVCPICHLPKVSAINAPTCLCPSVMVGGPSAESPWREIAGKLWQMEVTQALHGKDKLVYIAETAIALAVEATHLHWINKGDKSVRQYMAELLERQKEK